MVTLIWVNFGSGNGLLPDGTKPLPEPMLTFRHFHLRAMSEKIDQPSLAKLIWKLLT